MTALPGISGLRRLYFIERTVCASRKVTRIEHCNAAYTSGYGQNNLQTSMNPEIKAYNDKQLAADKEICVLLATTIAGEMAEAQSKIWHAHPVWFLADNPLVGYSKQKAGWRLMFWSGADFGEEKLAVKGKKFKDASIFYTNLDQINTTDLQRWLLKSKEIQWDYKNLVKRKGQLERLK